LALVRDGSPQEPLSNLYRLLSLGLEPDRPARQSEKLRLPKEGHSPCVEPRSRSRVCPRCQPPQRCSWRLVAAVPLSRPLRRPHPRRQRQPSPPQQLPLAPL